ncbi:hypothetical protein JOS77_25955 [Chromobacterium haemolyticum]|nr:hypothetical protein JOS77_25955 [Chromobacterium haemolyticum]
MASASQNRLSSEAWLLFRQAGHAQAGGEAQLRAGVRQRQFNAGDGGAQPLRHLARLLSAGIRQQNAEFLAAVAADQIRLTRLASQAVGQRGQRLVAGQVTVTVVDAFEMV